MYGPYMYARCSITKVEPFTNGFARENLNLFFCFIHLLMEAPISLPVTRTARATLTKATPAYFCRERAVFPRVLSSRGGERIHASPCQIVFFFFFGDAEGA